MKKRTPKISVIVPSLNDGYHARRHTAPLSADPSIEVVIAEAREVGRANRAAQMNWGAARARGDLLVFLHADTKIVPADLKTVHRRLQEQADCVGGAFRFALDASHAKAKWVEFGVLLRELAFGLPYGDQAIFVRRKIFREIGGYPKAPVLEDVLLIEKMRSKGRLYLAPEKAVTSARRWERHGYVKTTLANWGTMLLWKAGFSLKTLQGLRERVFS